MANLEERAKKTKWIANSIFDSSKSIFSLASAGLWLSEIQLSDPEVKMNL